MATAQNIAVTVGELRDELARRIDQLVADRDLTPAGAASLAGIVEWAAAVRTALAECNGVPTPTTAAEQFRHWESASRLQVTLTLAQAAQVEQVLGGMAFAWCSGTASAGRPQHELPYLIPDGSRKTSKILCLAKSDDLNADLLARLTGVLSTASGRNAASRVRHVLAQK